MGSTGSPVIVQVLGCHSKTVARASPVTVQVKSADARMSRPRRAWISWRLERNASGVPGACQQGGERGPGDPGGLPARRAVDRDVGGAGVAPAADVAEDEAEAKDGEGERGQRRGAGAHQNASPWKSAAGGELSPPLLAATTATVAPTATTPMAVQNHHFL